MSKMNDMTMTIEELRNAAAAISNVADWLTTQISDTVDERPVPVIATEPKTQLSLEKVRAVLADKSRAGHTATIRELLLKYGASKLSQIDPVGKATLYRTIFPRSDCLNSTGLI